MKYIIQICNESVHKSLGRNAINSSVEIREKERERGGGKGKGGKYRLSQETSNYICKSDTLLELLRRLDFTGRVIAIN